MSSLANPLFLNALNEHSAKFLDTETSITLVHDFCNFGFDFSSFVHPPECNTLTLAPDAASQVTGGSNLVQVGVAIFDILNDITSSSACQLYVLLTGAILLGDCWAAGSKLPS